MKKGINKAVDKKTDWPAMQLKNMSGLKYGFVSLVFSYYFAN